MSKNTRRTQKHIYKSPNIATQTQKQRTENIADTSPYKSPNIAAQNKTTPIWPETNHASIETMTNNKQLHFITHQIIRTNVRHSRWSHDTNHNYVITCLTQLSLLAQRYRFLHNIRTARSMSNECMKAGIVGACPMLGGKVSTLLASIVLTSDSM